MNHIKRMMKDAILKKRLMIAKNNDQSAFDERGDLYVLEEDSRVENNFFEVYAQTGSSLTVDMNA